MAGLPQTGLRNASGLALSRECTLWFWLAYLALLVSAWGLIAAELLWRVPDLVGFYFIEGLLTLCAPLGLLVLADSLTLRTYAATWYDLRDRGRALLLLEPEAVETLRRELRWHPLLGWLRPPASRDLAGQLLTASLWYRALLSPEGSAFFRRYGEQLGWALAFALLLVVPVGWIVALEQGLFEFTSVNLVGACGGAALLSLFGWQQLVILARRQTILDYFAVHRQARPTTTAQ